MEFFYGCRNGPGLDSFYLPLIHLDTMLTDVISQELDRGLVEGAFLSLEIELMLTEPLKDLRNVQVVFGLVPGVHQDVIDVHQHETVKVPW